MLRSLIAILLLERESHDPTHDVPESGQTGHNVVHDRPDWFVRDAIELLGRVRQRRPR